ncbi:MAG: hypothetical protein R8P61_23845 [Bacteroidia bacterium]|nr:hypothetical protein [Bacteroidia bacterium]
MKRSIYLLLGMLSGINILLAQSPKSTLMSFPITASWEDKKGNQILQISLPESVEWGKYSEATVLGIWTEEAPERNVELGKANLTQEDIPSLNFQLQASLSVKEGDLLQGWVRIPQIKERSMLSDLVAQQVWLIDVYGQAFYDMGTVLKNDSPDLEALLLGKMIADIRFVAEAMGKQGMEDTKIEQGAYIGKGVFEIMEKASLEQLKEFLGYIRFKPSKYRGHNWKVSEVFATWLTAGAPTESDFYLPQYNTPQKGTPDCKGEALKIDMEKGQLNGFSPSASMDAIKERFPCFSGESEEGMNGNCGGGVFYLKHGFFFYSHRDYLEVRSDFKGKMSLDVFGKSMDEVEVVLGKPKLIPVYEDDGNDLFQYTPDIHHLYKRKYGTLRITYDSSSKRVSEIGIHYKKPKEVEICW